MKRAIIIHGLVSKEEYFDTTLPSPSNSHWIPWLQKQLELNGISAEAVEMPDAWMPRYNKWKELFESFNVDEDTILIGHSLGGGFIIRYLSENNINVGKVILIAPWIDPDNLERDNIGDFFDFDINYKLSDQVKSLSIFVSNDDDEDILKSVSIIESSVENCVVYRFEDMGHFTFEDMKSNEFPELLDNILE